MNDPDWPSYWCTYSCRRWTRSVTGGGRRFYDIQLEMQIDAKVGRWFSWGSDWELRVKSYWLLLSYEDQAELKESYQTQDAYSVYLEVYTDCINHQCQGTSISRDKEDYPRPWPWTCSSLRFPETYQYFRKVRTYDFGNSPRPGRPVLNMSADTWT